MAETKTVKIKGTTWEVTPVTRDEVEQAVEAETLHEDVAHTIKYLGVWVERDRKYWLTRAFRKDIASIIETYEKNKANGFYD